MKKMLTWMRGVSVDLHNHIHDIFTYDNRLYLLVFWTNVLGLFHLILEPLEFVDYLYRKVKKPKADASTDDIPF